MTVPASTFSGWQCNISALCSVFICKNPSEPEEVTPEQRRRDTAVPLRDTTAGGCVVTRPLPRVRLPHRSTTSSAARGARTGPQSLADIIERLFSDFEPELPLPTIVSVVRRCRRELDIIAGPALSETLEKLARQRLTLLANSRATDPT